MQAIPRRPSLVKEVADVLRAGIRARCWGGFLPGERALCKQLAVSRNTLRKAVRLLEREGLVKSGQGSRRRIFAPSRGSRIAALPHVVGLLASHVTTHRYSWFFLYFIERLRARAEQMGVAVQVHSPDRYMIPHPERRLDSLVREHRARCWVLAGMPEPVQRWFSDHKLPAVVRGHRFAGVELPAVDRDHHAICRHAVGVLARLGHRRVAFLKYESGLAGTIAGERGFREGFAANALDPAGALVAEHDGTQERVCRLLDQWIARLERPTAILVADPEYMISVVTHLMRRGLTVPREMSLICREEDSHLQHVSPPIASYTSLRERLAERLCQIIIQIIQNGHARSRQILLMPEFRAGESLAAPLGHQKNQ